MGFMDFLQKLLQSFTKSSQYNQSDADYWNNKWKHNKVIYKAQGGFNRDVRTYLFDHSYLLEGITKRITGNDDEKALKILKWVMNNIKYKGDENVHKQKEFWQNPEETIQRKTGDCEDGALLIKSLALVAGIPDYKMKICCGNVKGGGHAYVIYLREKVNVEGTWCVLDWCFVDNRRTKVNTIKGMKRFSELKINDKIITFNEKLKKLEVSKIKKIGNRIVNQIYTIVYENGFGTEERISCTSEHPFYVKDKWVRADELKTGDEVYAVQNRTLRSMFVKVKKTKEHAMKIALINRQKGVYERLSKRQKENNIFTRPDVRIKLSLHNCMKNPEIVKKAHITRTNGKISNPEKSFQKIMNEHNLPVKYVGDGKFWIGKKPMNPDFIVEGKRKVIEVIQSRSFFRNYKEYIEKRKKSFEKYGFECLFVDFNKQCNKILNVNLDEIKKFVFNGFKIKKIIKRKFKKKVWNIHCEPNNNYFVNGILVHNCYWPNSLSINKRKEHKDEENYYDIWWTFNKEFTFAQTKAEYSKGNLKKKG